MDKGFTESKKMIAFIIAIVAEIVVTFAGTHLGLPADMINKLTLEILGLAGMAIGGQAMVDLMKKIADIWTSTPVDPKTPEVK